MSAILSRLFILFSNYCKYCASLTIQKYFYDIQAFRSVSGCQTCIYKRAKALPFQLKTADK